MKGRQYLFLFFASLFIISSCQKELSPDLLTQGQAEGNLVKNAAGDCSPIAVVGSYVQNTALGSSHYLEVQVNFTSIGDYVIKSDTINGYYFKATGRADSTGLKMIRLAGTGTPVATGTNVFHISFNNSVCQATVTVGTAAAVYTFGNNAGVCSMAIVGGTYTMAVPLIAANTVTIQVTVSSPGSYSINSTTVNGISFSASGVFSSTGPQNIILTGTGTPVAPGPFTFSSAATGGCTFIITVANPAGTLAQLTTDAASSILCTSAISGGNISNDGGSAITARGICYGTAANPTLANTVINNGTGTGAFTSNITNLQASTTYHLRAFATNSTGTAYGNDISFTTISGCQTTVYVAGRDDAYDISGNIPNPKIWVKPAGTFTGTALPFTPGVYNSEAFSVYATAADVYVAGAENTTATLWKNGVKISLSAPPSPPLFETAAAYSVFVSGTDVYVVGFSKANLATLWKNGVATLLSTSNLGSIANSVYVSGTDVYVAGYENEMVNSNLVSVAKVWKNGVATTLSTNTVNAVANSVFVSGSDVYVAGKEGNAAKLWKNGVGSTLSVTGTNKAVANSVFVYGTDVYVAGTEDDGTSPNSFAKLWKNNVGTLLTPTANYRNIAKSVYVVGANVYVAGTRYLSGPNTIASVWINGSVTSLTAGSTDAYANCIFVK